MSKIIHTGIVLKEADKTGHADVRVEAWDEAGIVPDMIGYAITDLDGRFTMVQYDDNVEVLFEGRKPVAYFRVIDKSGTGPYKVLAETKGQVTWDLLQDTSSSRIFTSDRALGTLKVLAPFVVEGTVYHVEDGPAFTDPAAVNVYAWDVRVDGERQLGSCSKDGRGRYRIEYGREDLLPGKMRADVQVRGEVPGEPTGTLVAQSEISCQAPPTLVVDLVTDGTEALLPAGTKYRGRTEQQAVADAVAALLGTAGVETLSDDEVRQVACGSGRSEDEVRTLRDAAKLEQAAPAVPRQAFYGIVRQGISGAEDELFAVPAAELRRSLERAVEERQCPYHDATALAQIESDLVEHQVSRAFNGLGTRANFGDMVKLALADQVEPFARSRGFVRSYSRRDSRDIAVFWDDELFQPRELSGCILWLRADRYVYKDDLGTPCADGDDVHRWKDQSGAAGHDAAETATYPSWNAGAAGAIAGVVFAPAVSGVPEHCTVSFSETSTSYTVVMRLTQGGSGYRVALSSIGAPALMFVIDDGGAGSPKVGIYDGSMRQVGDTPPNGDHTYTWVVDSAQAKVTVYIDGALLGSTAIAGTGKLNTLTDIGKQDDTNDGPIQSTVHEVLVFNQALDATGLQRLHAYAVGNDFHFSNDYTPEERKKLQLVLQWGALSRYYKPLIDKIDTLATNSLRDLAVKTKTDWLAIVGETGVPEDMPGETPTEKEDNYATVLARTMEKALFTAHLQGRLAELEQEPDVVKVLSNNESFELGNTRVAELGQAGDWTDVVDKPAAVARLKQYERLRKMSDEYDVMVTLLTKGFDSARAIARRGRVQFVNSVSGSMTVAKAEALHRKARCLTHLAGFVWGMLSAQTNGPKMDCLANYVDPDPTALGHAKLAGWEGLFGKLSLCRCKHCRSVYSPAAYLVDLLEFLDQYDTLVSNGSGGHYTAKQYLIGNGLSYLGRRPDIRHIELSCENTNTALPYVDLVNELLERHVAGTAVQSPIKTTAKTEELLATPEIREPEAYEAAYDTLSTDKYPWVLPYSVWQHQARVYLNHLGVPRHELMDLLQTRFKPSDVPGCVLWLRADTGVTIVAGRVTRWGDLSGGTNHAVEESAGTGPIYSAAGGSNDQPFLEFRTGERLAVLDATDLDIDALTDSVTVVLVTSHLTNAPPGNRYIVAKGDADTKNYGVLLNNSHKLAAAYSNGSVGGPDWGLDNSVAVVTASTLTYERTSWRRDGSPSSDEGNHDLEPNTERLYLGALKSEGSFPATSAYQGRLYEIIIYRGPLEQTDVEALEAYAAGRYGAVLTPLWAPTPTPLQIARERLGMSDDERGHIVTTSPANPWEHWGFPVEGTSPPWSEALTTVGTLLRASGLNYQELRELLDTGFAHALAAVPATPPHIEAESGTTGCHVEDQVIVGLQSDLSGAWTAIMRFLRLRSRLGWSVRDVDKVIIALAPPVGDPPYNPPYDPLDDGLIEKLGDLVALKAHQRLSRVALAELAAWWGDVDAQATPSLEEPSLFEATFLSRALTNPPTFDLATAGRLEDRLPDVLAALSITAADLRLLSEGEEARALLNLTPALADRHLTLESLSRLFRLVSFARRMRVRLPEVLVMQALTGISALTGDGAETSTPADTRAFIAELELVKESKLRVPELNYLLRHVVQPGTGIDSEVEATGARLAELDQGLAKIVEETNYVPDPTGAALRLLLEGELTRRAVELELVDAQGAPDPAAVSRKLAEVMAILDGTTALDTAEQEDTLVLVFGPLFEDVTELTSLVVFKPHEDLSASCQLWLEPSGLLPVGVTDQGGQVTGWTNLKTGGASVRLPTPKDVTGTAADCVLWLRADIGVTTDAVTGGVEQWLDQSGQGHHAAQSTDDSQPMPRPYGGVSGLAGIDFDGVDDFMSFDSGLASSTFDHTVVVVYQQRTLEAEQRLLSSGTTPFTLSAARPTAAPFKVAYFDGAGWTEIADAEIGDQYVTWVFGSGGSTADVYRDGLLLGTGTYSNTLYGGVVLGRASGAAMAHFDGVVSEIIVYKKKLDTNELRRLHGILTARYGLGGSPGTRATKTGPFGLGAVELSSVDDHLFVEEVAAQTAHTFVCVVRQDALEEGKAKAMLHSGAADLICAAQLQQIIGSPMVGAKLGADLQAHGYSRAGDQILTWVLTDGGSPTSTVYRDGEQLGNVLSYTTQVSLSGLVGLGGWAGQLNDTFNGAIACAGLFDAALGATDLARVHHYLYKLTGDARRYEAAHRALLDDVRRRAAKSYVVQTLATAHKLAAETVEALVGQWLTSLSDASQPLVHDLLPVEGDPSPVDDEARLGALFRVGKAAKLVSTLAIEPSDLEGLLGESRDTSWLHFDDLPVVLRPRFRFAAQETAIVAGAFALPYWLTITCATTGRTIQTSPSTVRSGFGADTARAHSLDGARVGLAVEPDCANLVGNEAIENWPVQGGNAVGHDIVLPDGSEHRNKLEDTDTGAAPSKAYTLQGSLSIGWHTLSAWSWVHDDPAPTTGALLPAVIQVIPDLRIDPGPIPDDEAWTLRAATVELTTVASPAIQFVPRHTTASDLGSASLWGVQLEARKYPTSFAGLDASFARAKDVLRCDLASIGVAADGYFDVTITYAPLYAQGETTASEHDLIFFDADNRLYFKVTGGTATIVLRLGGSDVLSSDPVTFGRLQELTVRAVHALTGVSLVVTGATTGNGSKVAAPVAPMASAPTEAYVLGNASGAQEGALLYVLDFGSDLPDARRRYRGLMAMVRALSLRDTFRAKEGGLFELLAQAKTGVFDLPGFVRAASAQANWAEADVAALGAAFGWREVMSMANAPSLDRLREACGALNRLGATATQALGWLSVDEVAASGIATAESILRVAKAKHGGDRWSEIGRPLRDEMRDAQREALVAYMVQNPPAESGVVNADTLYQWLLIDVEMSPCALTSRILQATLAVQLFVQRCLMNLESAVVTLDQDAARAWQWMKNYRVWEANRKVFLYPENWMEPDWRDDRTPLFEEVESFLRQGALDEERCELAYRRYVDGLLDIAALDTVGMAHEIDTESEVDRLHFVARSPSPPYRNYHRMWIDRSRWTPWMPIDLELTDHVTLMVVNGRPTLVWAEITGERVEYTEAVSSDPPGATLAKWTFELTSLSSSRFEFGAWQSPRVTRELPGGDRRWEGDDYYYLGPAHPDIVVRHVGEALSFFTVLPALPPAGDIAAEGRFVLAKPIVHKGTIVNSWSYDPCARSMVPFEAEGVTAYFSAPYLTRGPHNWQGNALGLWVYHLNNYVEIMGLNSGSTYPIALAAPARAILSDDWVVHPPFRHFVFTHRGRRLFSHPYRAPALEDPGTAAGSVALADASTETWHMSNHADVHLNLADDAVDYETSDPVLAPGFFAFGELKLRSFYHPWACALARKLDAEGLEALTRWNNDYPVQHWGAAPYFLTEYDPNENVVRRPYPKDDVDFSFRGAYSVYNWELFFHLPFLIATRLMEDERFEEARKWLHAIFDPTDAGEGAGPADTWRFWKVKPLRNLASLATVQQASLQPEAELDWNSISWGLLTKFSKMMNADEEDFDLDEQIYAWRADPFRPFVVARMRPVAFQKATVLRYIDNLMRWGDKLFRRDTLESLNEATQLYILAKSLLGERPIFVDRVNEPEPLTYDGLEAAGIDFFSNALIEMESILVADPPARICDDDVPPPVTQLYFCVPHNDKLIELWDVVEDRLFKLRHCMNIEGIVRQLPLFEPPIDPALLVEAVAAGVDISSVLDDMASPRPHYRFNVILPKAVELVQMVVSFGASLLGAIEKQDGEALALMRQRHEIGLHDLTRQVRKDQIKEAKENLKALEEGKKVVEKRRDFYRDIEKISDMEMDAIALTQQAADFTTTAQGIQLGAAAAHAVPDLYAGGVPGGASGAPMPYAALWPGGGSKAGPAVEAAAQAISLFATLRREDASQTATLAGYNRRWNDWKLQERLADQELKQVDKQIAAAELRIAIAEQELQSVEQQRENAKAVERYLKDKFTSERLYTWQKEKLSEAYFQAYKLAYRVARAAEQAYRFERGEPDASFVKFGYWDSRRQGLVAGERMLLDLRRMDTAYLEKNRREHELTKSISLGQLDPVSLLTLRATGQCTVEEIPEAVFDLDYPGHYMRRIKSVSLTVPAVAGPHDGVHCTLTLLSNRIRKDNVVGDAGYAEDMSEPSSPDSRFIHHYGAITSVCTSSAQNDSGMFELSFRDERYLPFEGAGVISGWKIELPHETNRFDVSTVTDVIINVSYTAREGGAALGAAAKEAAFEAQAVGIDGGLDGGVAVARRLYQVSQDLPGEWYKLHNELDPDEGDQILSVSFDGSVPFLPGQGDTEVVKLHLAASWGDTVPDLVCKVEAPSGIVKQGVSIPGLPSPPEPISDYATAPEALGTWTLIIAQADIVGLGSALTELWPDNPAGKSYKRIRPDKLRELFLIVDVARQRTA